MRVQNVRASPAVPLFQSAPCSILVQPVPDLEMDEAHEEHW